MFYIIIYSFPVSIIFLVHCVHHIMLDCIIHVYDAAMLLKLLVNCHHHFDLKLRSVFVFLFAFGSQLKLCCCIPNHSFAI